MPSKMYLKSLLILVSSTLMISFVDSCAKPCSSTSTKCICLDNCGCVEDNGAFSGTNGISYDTCTTQGDCPACPDGQCLNTFTNICEDITEVCNTIQSPCNSVTCADGEVCIDNYCNGCNSQCFACETRFGYCKNAAGECMEDQTAECLADATLADPCKGVTCGDSETCVPNFCGDCHYECVACDSIDGFCIDSAGLCQEISLCITAGGSFTDPCSTNPCNDDETCVADYCGGCNYICQPKLTCPDVQQVAGGVCAYEGMTCTWGEETCCGETHASYSCTCSGGTATCMNTDACMAYGSGIIDCPCPEIELTPGAACFYPDASTCYWGEETCCGETYDSYGCTCSGGTAACFNTDACLDATCGCADTMEYSDCISSSCNPGPECGIQMCTMDCAPDAKCKCKSETPFYSKDLGKCISEDECPVSCPDTMEYSDCISSSCKPGPACGIQACTDDCATGCKCKSDTPFYSEKLGKCIAEEECTVTCPDTMEYSDCISSSCNPGPACGIQMCTMDCAPDATCKCKSETPYYSEDLGKCISEKECSITCADTMEYSDCISSSCNPGPACGVQICTMDCAPDAECKCKSETPFYSADLDKCISEKECVSCEIDEILVNGVCVDINCAVCKTYNNGCQECECTADIDEAGKCDDRQCITMNEPYCLSCWDGYSLSNGICVEDSVDDCSAPSDGWIPFGTIRKDEREVCRFCKHKGEDFCEFMADLLDPTFGLKDCFYEYCGPEIKSDVTGLVCEEDRINLRDDWEDLECGCGMFECVDTVGSNGVNKMGVMIVIGFGFALLLRM